MRQFALILISIGALLFLAAIIYGLLYADFGGEGKQILQLVWGQITLFDLYLGIALFAGWVIFRDGWGGFTGLWLLSFILLGNLATCCYVLLRLWQCRDNWQQFWLGRYMQH